jgi:hypothetical protein
MQLIYKTDSSARADTIQELLERAGIPAAVHGAGLHSLLKSRAADAVSVWVVRDEDLARAQAVLNQFFQQEAGHPGVPHPARPTNRKLRALLLALAAFLVCMLALLAASGA